MCDGAWRAVVVDTRVLRQGYLSSDVDRVVRVRLVAGARAFLTVKGRRVGDRRSEFEYEVPADDAEFMLDHLCLRPLIAKRRHLLSRGPGEWVVDEFLDDNAGLVVAEIESAEATALTDLPGWLGLEVTTDDRYANSSLQARPYGTWGS